MSHSRHTSFSGFSHNINILSIYKCGNYTTRCLIFNWCVNGTNLACYISPVSPMYQSEYAPNLYYYPI